MAEPTELLFHVPFASGEVDEKAGIIRGVSLITGSLTAEGHALEVDDTTLQQVFDCAKKMGKVPVKLNHGSGVEQICGYMDNFRLDKGEGKVRGDWHLLITHEETPKMLERAQRMPSCFGMSVAFKGKGEGGKGGKKFARCHKLKAVDCVTDPAANPDGLFSAKTGVDTAGKGMAEDNTTKQEPSLADVLAGLNSFREEIGQRLDALEQFQNDIVAEIEKIDGDNDPEPEPEPEPEPKGGTVGAELAALRKQVIQLSAEREEEKRFSEQQEVDHAFAVIEAKVHALSEQNAELVELCEKLQSENGALKIAVKSGTKPVAPGVEGVTLFGAKDAPTGSFEQLATAKFEELKAAGVKELRAKSEAIDFCVKNHKAAYQEYRSRGGKLKL